MSIAYKKDYWGFVYIWLDRRSGMFCVGSHLGSLDDGYTSSTGVFEKAFIKRPEAFRRRILFLLKENDWAALLREEDRWLSFIDQRELSTAENHKAGTVRYYNCKKYALGGAWNRGRVGVQSYPKRECHHCGGWFTAAMHASWHGDRCIKNPHLLDLTYRQRKKRIKQPAYVGDNVNAIPHESCTVCGLVTSRGNIKRWHGVNCRPRRQRNDVVARRPLMAEAA